MASFLDRVIFLPAAGGTASFVVASAVTGYLTPAQAGATNAASYRYAAETRQAVTGTITAWEVGTGVYTSATTTLTRVPEFSSNGNALVNFGSPPNVMLTVLAADIGPGGANTEVQFNDNGSFAGDADLTWAPGSGGLVINDSLALGIKQDAYLYNTFTDDSNYERMTCSWNITSNDFVFKTQAAGTGTLRPLVFWGSDTSAVGTPTPINFVGTGSAAGITRISFNCDTANAGLALQENGTLRYSLAFFNNGNTKRDFIFVNEGAGTLPIWINGDTSIVTFGGSTGYGGLISASGKLTARIYDNSANADVVTKTVFTDSVAVASLPTAGTAGRRAFVNNATSTTFASIVAGVGANLVPVYDDGTNWRIG